MPAGAAQLAAHAGALDCADPGNAPATTFPPIADLVYATVANVRLAGFPITLRGRTITSWRTQAGRYEATLHTKSLEAIEFDQHSTGQIGAAGALLPQHYQEKRPFHASETVDLDWAAGHIRFGLAPPVAAPDRGAQDRLSLQFSLARAYLCQPGRFASGATVDIALIGPRDVDPWQLHSAGEDTIDTALGAERAVHLSAQRTVGNAHEAMDIWLSLAVRGLPVRIRMLDRNQSVIDSVLQEVAFPVSAR